MATWEVYLRLVPRTAVLKEYGRVPVSLSREQYENGNWWKAFDDADQLVDQLNSTLATRASWSAHLRGWGSDDGNRIDLRNEDGRISELTARIDARDPVRFSGILADLASRFDLVAINDAFSVRVLTPDQIRLEVMRSGAAEFVSDPEAYLRGLDQRTDLKLD